MVIIIRLFLIGCVTVALYWLGGNAPKETGWVIGLAYLVGFSQMFLSSLIDRIREDRP